MLAVWFPAETWNITSVIGKEPELVCEARYSHIYVVSPGGWESLTNPDWRFHFFAKRQFRVPSLLGVIAWGAGGCSTWQSLTLVVERRGWEERHAWSERCLLLLTFPVFCWAVSTCFKDVALQPSSKWASIFHETLTCLSTIDIVLLWIKFTRFVNHYIQLCFVF